MIFLTNFHEWTLDCQKLIGFRKPSKSLSNYVLIRASVTQGELKFSLVSRAEISSLFMNVVLLLYS